MSRKVWNRLLRFVYLPSSVECNFVDIQVQHDHKISMFVDHKNNLQEDNGCQQIINGNNARNFCAIVKKEKNWNLTNMHTKLKLMDWRKTETLHTKLKSMKFCVVCDHTWRRTVHEGWLHNRHSLFLNCANYFVWLLSWPINGGSYVTAIVYLPE